MPNRRYCCTLLMALLLGTATRVEAARKPLDFLPPVATINGKIDPKALATPEPVETVSLTAIASPVLKTRPPVSRLDNDLGIRTSTQEFQSLLSLQRSLDEDDLKHLWSAVVEKNPVIRFSLEKLATPTDLHPQNASRFLNRTLNVLISGATLATTMVPGGGSYRNMGAMAGGDALRNLVNGRTPTDPNALSPTEQIQLAGLVDELQAKVVRTYHDYKNTLQTLTTAHSATVRHNRLYSQAMANNNPLAVMAAGTAYYKALQNETRLRQQAKLYRLELERLAGKAPLEDLRLSLSVTSDLLDQGSQGAQGSPSAPKEEAPPQALVSKPTENHFSPQTVLEPEAPESFNATPSPPTPPNPDPLAIRQEMEHDRLKD